MHQLVKYLSNFWRSLEMPLINCKVESKFKSMNHYVFFGNGNDYTDADLKKTIFTFKETKLYVPVVTLSSKDNQKPSKHFSKGVERSIYWNECKTESEKIGQMSIDIFWNQILHELTACSF